MSGFVTVVGALHLDVIVNSPNIPAIDETIIGNSVHYRLGGKGGNQAVAASLSGAEVEFAGLVGKDQFGDRIITELENSGVDIRQVERVNGASGMSVAIVDSNGEYCAVVVSGVNKSIDPEKITISQSTKVLLLQNEIPEFVNQSILSKIDSDKIVILNYAPADTNRTDLFEKVDILVVNKIESQLLSGTDSNNYNPSECAMKLQSFGPKTVIITLGADGFVLANENYQSVIVPALPVDAVSSHGAGDFFIGSMAAELANGEEIEKSVEFAHAAATLYVGESVDSKSTVTRERIVSYLKEIRSFSFR